MYFAHNSRLDFQPFVLGIDALEFVSLSHEIVRELGWILDKWDDGEEVPRNDIDDLDIDLARRGIL